MTTKKISFDFEPEFFVGIEAPEGTDPETLREQAAKEFIRRLKTGEGTVICFQTFDPESTGLEKERN